MNGRLLHGILAALALTALALNAGRPGLRSGWWSKVRLIPYMARTWEGRSFRSFEDPGNPIREMVSGNIPPGAAMAFVSPDPSGIDSLERSYHISVAWERIPGRVPFLSEAELPTAETDWLVVPPHTRKNNWNVLLDAGFVQIADVPSVESLWMREEPGACESAGDDDESAEVFRTKDIAAKRTSGLREAMGLALVAAVVLCGAWAAGWTGALLCVAGWILALGAALVAGWTGATAAAATAGAVAAAAAVRRFTGSRFAGSAHAESEPFRRNAGASTAAVAAATAAWTLLASLVTLCHTLSPPNGLGVSGGRAALWLLSGGIPEGFFSDPALATFQPSYPPGLALLTLGAWGAAGGVGEWLSQLLALAPFCALLWLLLSRAPSFAAKFWVFALFCTGTALNMASLYYSEGWMLLFLCVGLSRLPRASRDGDGTGDVFLSWTLIGFAGFFKNEGILFAGLLWAVVRCFRGRRAAPLPALLASLAPALAWIAFSRWCGGALEDYAPLWAPDGGRFIFALGRILRDAFLAPWATGFAWPLATVVAVASVVRRFAGSKPASPAFASSARETAALLLLSIPVFAFVYSLSRAPDLDWHVWSSLPRLLWDAAVLATALRVGSLPIPFRPVS